MKKLILSSALFTLALIATAQSKSDLVVKNACDCINKWESDNYTYDELVQKLGSCIAPDLLNHYDELKKELNITEDDYTQSMSMIGEKLGERLALECPRFMELSMKMLQQDDQLKEKVMDRIENGEPVKNENFTGKVDKVKTDGGLTGISVSSQDESLYFIWLEKFSGSEAFEKNPESLKGKRVSVTYYEKSIYDGASKTYVKKKIISKLEVVS